MKSDFMKIKKLLILTTLLLTSCTLDFGYSSITSSSEIQSNSENPSSSLLPDDSSNPTPSGEYNLKLEEPNYQVPRRNSKEEFVMEDLFNVGNKVEVTVEISDDELNELQVNYEKYPKSEIYRVCDKVTISITNYENVFTWEFLNVGIRQKGNTSRDKILINGEINPQNHYKLSFDETFDNEIIYSQSFISEMKIKMGGEDYSKRDFLGLSGLDFKWNKNNDLTHLKEKYANDLYRAAGIMTQHTGLASFSMVRKDKNNQVTSFGLCNVFEQAKKSFVKNSLSSGDYYLNMSSWEEEQLGSLGVANEKYGDLYKCTYGVGDGLNSSGADMTLDSINNQTVGVGDEFGVYVPSYERKTNTNVDYDDTLLKNLIDKINNSTYQEINKYIDLEIFGVYEAINFIVGNPDSLRYNYNNYMIYFRRTDGKAVLIPLDNDRVFGITKDLDFKNGLTDTFPLDKSTLSGTQRNPLYLKTIFSNQDNLCKNIYLNSLKSLVNSPWLEEETFNQLFALASNTYSSYQFSHNDENISFSSYINSKIDTIGGVESEEDDKVYNNLYIVGNFNNWGNYPSNQLETYKMNYQGDYTYTYQFEVKDSLDNNTFKFKFNNGYSDYSEIDWYLDLNSNKLVKNGSGISTSLTNVLIGDVVYISINTKTLDASVVIKSKEEGSSSSSQNSSTDQVKYPNLYLVGNFNSWGDYFSDQLEQYHFSYLGNDTYQIILVISNNLENDELIFKINAGQGNYQDIDWTLDSSLTKLIMDRGNNASLSNVYKNDIIKITINTSTLDATVEKIGG